MRLGQIAFLLLVGCFVGAVMAPVSAAAMIGDRVVLVSKGQRDALADKTEFSLRDAVEHRELHFQLREKTFGQLEPGDMVDADGEPHLLREITHRDGWSQYIFTEQSLSMNGNNSRPNGGISGRFPNGR